MAVEDAGYDARLLRDGSDRTRVRLRVDGMLCSSCSGKVEAALRAAPGVRQAAVSLVTHKAEVLIPNCAIAPCACFLSFNTFWTVRPAQLPVSLARRFYE